MSIPLSLPNDMRSYVPDKYDIGNDVIEVPVAVLVLWIMKVETLISQYQERSQFANNVQGELIKLGNNITDKTRNK